MFFHEFLAYRENVADLFFKSDQNFNWAIHRFVRNKVVKLKYIGCLSIVKTFACLFVTFESLGLNNNLRQPWIGRPSPFRWYDTKSNFVGHVVYRMYVVNIGWNIFRNQLSPFFASFQNWVLVSVSISTMYIIFVGGNIQSLGK